MLRAMWNREGWSKVDICRGVIRLITMFLLILAIFKMRSIIDKLQWLEQHMDDSFTDLRAVDEELQLFNHTLSAMLEELDLEIINVTKKYMRISDEQNKLHRETLEHVNFLGSWGPFYVGDYIVPSFRLSCDPTDMQLYWAVVHGKTFELGDGALCYWEAC